jgi:hypothetical protein
MRVLGGCWANDTITFRWMGSRVTNDKHMPRLTGLRAVRVEVGP